MTMTLSWRKTISHYVLTDWEGVLQKSELPPEYTNTPGQKFWYIPTQCHIQLGGDDIDGLIGVTFPALLCIGTTLTPKQHESLINYITAAVKRLREAEIEMKTAKNIKDVL